VVWRKNAVAWMEKYIGPGTFSLPVSVFLALLFSGGSTAVLVRGPNPDE